jgi:hypothetical protein
VELPYQTALNLIKDLNLAGSDPEHPVNPDLMQTTWDVINLRCEMCTGKRWVWCYDLAKMQACNRLVVCTTPRRDCHGLGLKL